MAFSVATAGARRRYGGSRRRRDRGDPPVEHRRRGRRRARRTAITISQRNPRRICVRMKRKLRMSSSAPSSRVGGTSISSAATTSVPHASWFIVQKTALSGRPRGVPLPPVPPHRIAQAELHAVVARVAGRELVDAGRQHDEREVHLQDEQREAAQVRREAAGVFEQEDGEAGPVRHEAGRAHAAQDALPPHVDEEVAAERQVDERRPRTRPARRSGPRRSEPDRHAAAGMATGFWTASTSRDDRA